MTRPFIAALGLNALAFATVVLAQLRWNPDDHFGLWAGTVFGAPLRAFAVQTVIATRALGRPGAADRDGWRALSVWPYAVTPLLMGAVIAPAAPAVTGDTPTVLTIVLWVVMLYGSQFLGGVLVGVSFLLPLVALVAELAQRVLPGRSARMPLSLLLFAPCWWIGVVLGVLAMDDDGSPNRMAAGRFFAQAAGLAPAEDPGLMWVARALLLLPIVVGAAEWPAARRRRRRVEAAAG